ncbi:25316_t:CDS:1, partial [Gigaspora rosea]
RNETNYTKIEIDYHNISITNHEEIVTISLIEEISQENNPSTSNNNLDELFEEFINDEVWDQIQPGNNEKDSKIMQLKRSLSYNTNTHHEFAPPFIANNDILVIKNIILKIKSIGNRKSSQVDRLETTYYLEKLIENQTEEQLKQTRKLLNKNFNKKKFIDFENKVSEYINSTKNL